MMRYLHRYLGYRPRRRAIRRWIKANGLPLVAKAMFKLNRYARAKRIDRSRIYAFKNHFIRLLYERYPHPVTVDKQTLTCYACSGTGYEDRTGEECWKCEGTGIYREYILYRFDFSIAGQRYVWHQPKRLVDWEVEIDRGQFGYREYRGGWVMGIEVIGSEEKNLLMGVLYEWLRMNGVVEIPEPWDWCPSMWDCIYMDIAGWWINSRPGRWTWKMGRKIKRALEILDIVEKPEEPGVPF